jgi:hypothetical protein
MKTSHHLPYFAEYWSRCESTGPLSEKTDTECKGTGPVVPGCESITPDVRLSSVQTNIAYCKIQNYIS